MGRDFNGNPLKCSKQRPKKVTRTEFVTGGSRRGRPCRVHGFPTGEQVGTALCSADLSLFQIRGL